MNEHNSRLGQAGNNYPLTRTRVYVDLWYEDRFRVFVELITAFSSWQILPCLPIDENNLDFLNAFVDVKVGEVNEKPVLSGPAGRNYCSAPNGLFRPSIGPIRVGRFRASAGSSRARNGTRP